MIETSGAPAGAYVASVTVDGSPWTSISIPHAVVVGASRIVVELSETPTGWASDTRPVSASAVHGYRDAPVDVLPVGASALTDDTGRTATALAAGVPVSFPVDVAAASLYTVTVAAPGTYAWSVSLGGDGDGDGTEAASGAGSAVVTGAVFDWAGQTRVFRVAGGGSTFAFTPETDMVVTQLELIASDGQR